MSFREIVGHRRLKRLLARAVRSGTLPPSLVFAGPEGVGKRQMAYALAQALNCLAPVDGAEGERDACGTCASCSRIARGLHPDVVLVRRPEDKSAIVISQARDLVRQVGYRPFEGRCRVVVIDDADELGGDSQDALLKTLEEPPARNVFVLVTSRPNLLSTTVRSRCCVLRFAPLAAAEIAGALAGAHGFSDADAQAAAALSGGSFARAMGAGARERAQARAVAAAVLMETAQTTDVRARLAVSAALLKSAARKGKDTDKDRDREKEGKSAGADRESVAVRLNAMGSLLRDLAVLTTRAPGTALVNLDLRADLEPLARHYDRDRLARAFSAVGRSLGALERNASPKIVADWLVLQL
ncbi:MAG: AAA family ATPase [Vicinamibacterales bacterium]|jgi:DNA polymerase-3 subunit delta'|nr:AAA family ATPase [Vicinamibacterales bacterium]